MLNGTSTPTHETNVFSTLKQTDTKITNKRPSSINEISDFEQRQKAWRLFRLAEELYMGPLGNYLAILTRGEQSYNKLFKETDDLSIVERAVRMRDTLLKHGGTLENILSLVPRTEEEEDILMCAKNNGFTLDSMLSNVDKVAAAQEYLRKMNISSTYGVENKTR